MHTYGYIHAQTHVHVFISVHGHTYVHTYVCIYLYTCTLRLAFEPYYHTTLPDHGCYLCCGYTCMYICAWIHICSHAYTYLRLHMCTATRLRAILSCYSSRHLGCCYFVDIYVCIHVCGFIYIHTHIFTYTHEHSDSPSSNTVMLLFQTMGAAISGAPGILYIFFVLCVWSGTDLSVGGRLGGDVYLLQCVAVRCSVLQFVAIADWCQ